MQKLNSTGERNVHMQGLYLLFFPPYFLSTCIVSSWSGIYGMFSLFALLILWVSYDADLLSPWYSNLADAQVPWLYLVRRTPAHNICQNIWPSRILHLLLSPPVIHLTSPPSPSPPPPPPALSPFLSSSLDPLEDPWRPTWHSWWQTEIFFINKIPQPDVCEPR